ncbi:MAG: exodeoxyribonuclease VII small subunit [Acidimicrobiales bacterium]
MTADPSSPQQPGYAAAMAELEGILAQLEDERLDIDDLADHVARAADLVALCRERLDAARMRVTEIVADLDGATGSD